MRTMQVGTPSQGTQRWVRGHSRERTRRWWAAPLALIALVFAALTMAACGGDSGTSTPAAGGGTPASGEPDRDGKRL